ncbi:MAG TPA: hypothetical protein VJO54_15065, partial [Burkholderiales bacterium]|nr:hypothetical protein [Burkholderiales bacterium]
LTGHIAQLKSELVGMADEVLANSPKMSSEAGLGLEKIGAGSLVEVIVAVHSLARFVPEKSGWALKQMLYGIEDLHALTDAFIRALSSAKNPNDFMRFEVSDRTTGRALLVALPPAAYPHLATDLKKILRELKRLRKEIIGG